MRQAGLCRSWSKNTRTGGSQSRRAGHVVHERRVAGDGQRGAAEETGGPGQRRHAREKFASVVVQNRGRAIGCIR